VDERIEPEGGAGPEHDEPAAAEPHDTAVGAGAVATAAAGGDVTHQASLWGDAWRQLRRNPVFLASALIIAVLALMAAFPSLFTSADPRACDLSRSVETPSSEHIFGFDLQGCDYYAQVIYGARVSMIIGLATVFSAGLIAVILGSIAGFYGRGLDSIISRITDVWFGLPTLLAALVFLAVLGQRGLFQVTLVLAAFGWPTMLRLMRSSVIETRQRDYVAAARALGASDLRIIQRHILPNAIAPVIIYGTILVGIVIAAEATLTFLGVGLGLPNISWGLMLNSAQNRVRNSPHLLLFPGLFLSVTVLAFIMLGDALRDALDPRSR
jgi:oligopeptide transport system permease protein